MNLDTVAAPLSLPSMLLNLALGMALSLVLAWYYTRYGSSLSNRSQFAPVLPMLAMITLLVITIVKSSLALSLGLVGALADDGSQDSLFSSVNDLLLKEFHEVDLRRLDHTGGQMQLTYYIYVRDETSLIRAMDALRMAYPGGSVSLVEQNNLLGG